MKKQCNRLFSLLLVVAMLCSMIVLPTSAAGAAKIKFEKIDNSAIAASKENKQPLEAGASYRLTDKVRVSIVLKDEATIERFSTTGIAANQAAISYRSDLQSKQDAVASAISQEVLSGEKLDVVWNLTLAANIISANVQYGQIDKIKAVAGVADVVIETRYEPDVASVGELDPKMATSAEQIGSAAAYADGYTGAGTRIAIIDTGSDLDHQSLDAGAFTHALSKLDVDVTSLGLLDEAEIAAVLSQLNIGSRVSDASKLYVNAKIPFGYNYVDKDFDITHDNDTQGEHGSHVAGIATANRFIPNGDGTYADALTTVHTQGVAPDAQLITMKVFGKNGGAYDSDYMVAIEDAIVLGCDSVNLSLGSGNAGFSNNSNTTYQKILDNLADTDTVVAMSAGNSGSWVDNAQTAFANLYATDINMQTDGSPGSFTNSLAVASVDNSGATGAYLSAGETLMFYNETSGKNQPMTTIAGEQEYVFIDGVGTEAEFAALKNVLAGKIAICSRGTTSFYEKGNAAVKNGAIGVIIYNNQPGTINMNLDDYSYTAPCVSVTQANGAVLKANAAEQQEGDATYYLGTMTVSSDVASGDLGADYYTMSDFSSWGVPGSLELKPEITAPGGNIYSLNGVVPGGKAYEVMSGTSMASPQIAGMAALVAQYIKENGLAEQEGVTVRALSQSLLMSTAKPVIEEGSKNYYSVLKQGAGLANVGAAVSANSYILMGENATKTYADGKVKAELGADPAREGVYSFSFSINNMTSEAQKYALSADLFTQDLFEGIVNNAGETGMYMDTLVTNLAAITTWKVNGVSVANSAMYDFNGDNVANGEDAVALLEYVIGVRESITNLDKADLNGDGKVNTRDAYIELLGCDVEVPANGSVQIDVEIALTEAQKQALNTDVTNGSYIEGYVFVNAATTEEGVEGETHSIPVLGFYGNWSDASMFEVGSRTASASGKETRAPYLGKANANAVIVQYAGDASSYYFGGNPYFAEGAAYDEARNALSAVHGDKIAGVQYSLIRNAAAGRLTVTNLTTGAVEYTKNIGQSYAAYYHTNSSRWMNTSASQSMGFTPKGNDGDRYEVKLTMAPEYYVKNGVVDWDALGEGASKSLTFTVDNTAPEIKDVTVSEDKIITASVQDNQYLSVAFLINAEDKVVGKVQPVQNEAGEVVAISFDGSNLANGVYTLQVNDYADNASTYRIFYGIELTNDVESVTLNASTKKVIKGNTAQLSAAVAPENVSDASVTWTTSDASVATVDANGLVTGIGIGSCTVTATSNLDTTKSASCTINVESIAVTVFGALQDESGAAQLFGWNMETMDTWAVRNSFDTTMDINSVAWDWMEEAEAGATPYLYVQDVNALMRKVDVDEGTQFESTGSANAFGAAVQDMDFAFYGRSLATPREYGLFGIFGSYLLASENAMSNNFGTGWNLSSYLASYSGGTKFVGLTWGGIDSQNRDVMTALDDAGYIWLLRYNGTSSIGLGYIETDLNLSFPMNDNSQYCSLQYDDDLDKLYLSYFTGEANELYMLEFENGKFVSTKIGEFGNGVWPAALFMVSPNAATASNTASRVAAVNEAAESTAAIATVEAAPVVLETQRKTQAEKQEGQSDADDALTIDVTAKNAEGVDVTTNNGRMTVTYDPSVLKLESVNMSPAYHAYNAASGSVTLAYATLSEIPAGKAVATLKFSRLTKDATSVTVTNVEQNAETDAFDESFFIDADTSVKMTYVYADQQKVEMPQAGEAYTMLGADAFYTGAYDGDSFQVITGWMDQNGKTYALGEEITAAEDLTLTAVTEKILLLRDGYSKEIIGIMKESEAIHEVAAKLSYDPAEQEGTHDIIGSEFFSVYNGLQKDTYENGELRTTYTFAGWFYEPYGNEKDNWDNAYWGNSVGKDNLFGADSKVEGNSIYAYWINAGYLKTTIAYTSNETRATNTYALSTVPADLFKIYGFVLSTGADATNETLVKGAVINGMNVASIEKTSVYSWIGVSPFTTNMYANVFNGSLGGAYRPAGIPGTNGYLTYAHILNIPVGKTVSARAYYVTQDGTIVYGTVAKNTIQKNASDTGLIAD